jgi:hypothetical protein
MYTRDVQQPISTPIINGVPVAGTWDKAFEHVDLLTIEKPYSVALHSAVREARIKEWESWAVENDEMMLLGRIANYKFFRAAKLCFYDKKLNTLCRYSKYVPFGAWKLPESLSNAALESRSFGFLLRVHPWLAANQLKIDIDIAATRKRQAFTAHLAFNMNEKKAAHMACGMLFSERRPMYAFKTVTPVRGDVVFGDRHYSIEPERSSGLFHDYKGFFPYRMAQQTVAGLGFVSGRRLGFSVGENAARDVYKVNESALWLDGGITYLPPIRITMPDGPDNDWVIQDMEGMVDLVFSPAFPAAESFNALVAAGSYTYPIGKFTGMLMDKTGEKLPVKDIWGAGESLYMRI